MREAFQKFRSLVDISEIEIVYYAGHGIEIAGQNYLVPVDARLEEERDATIELVNVDVALQQMSGAEIVKMLVLDACRNSPFLA